MRTIRPEILSIAFTSKQLCTRCGTCAGVCPEQAISFDEHSYPLLNADRCTECGLCAKTCPGGAVHFQHLAELTFGAGERDVATFDGHVKRTYVGQAIDPATRRQGAGGGVVTALFSYLLRSGAVTGCAATMADLAHPWKAKSFIARSEDELRRSQGSRYTVMPHNDVLRAIRATEGRYVYAGLPCHIHGLRIACERDAVLRERIVAVIGLFCGGALEPYFVPELLATKGLDVSDIKDFEFRGGDWPGKMRAFTAEGRLVELHQGDYKDGAYIYSTFLYSPMRCLTCIDGSSQFADISVSDVWTRDARGEYRFREHSRLFVRTAVGIAIVEQALRAGTLQAHDVTADAAYATHQLQTKRKRVAAPLRVERLKRKNIAVPHYDRLLPEEPTLGEHLSERFVTAVHYAARIPRLRYMALKVLTSPVTAPLIELRRRLKRRKYIRRSKLSETAAVQET